MADLLSIKTFTDILENPHALHVFGEYLENNDERHNLKFYIDTQNFDGEVSQGEKFFVQYVKNPDKKKIKISSKTEKILQENISKKEKNENLFKSAREDVADYMFENFFKHFVLTLIQSHTQRLMRSDDTMMKAETLFGVGDCFCITDPFLHDNPIILSSDGFSLVTGYSRDDIINSNCRFLQGQQTERDSVKRIRLNIDNKTPHTELLLNYRKDGTPFWNLLFVCPMTDVDGETLYFLGGQIDVTKNLNNSGNLGNLLNKAYEVTKGSDPVDEIIPMSKKKPLLPWKKSIKPRVLDGRIGAETNIVNDSLSLEDQTRLFYDTYSHYIVYHAGKKDNTVKFVSDNLLKTVGFPKSKVIGSTLDLFCGAATQKDRKKTIQDSLKSGTPISLMIKLYSKVGEAYDVHFHGTPVKDVDHKVQYLVCVQSWNLADESIEKLIQFTKKM